MANSRNKGAAGEREAAQILFLELGVKLRRNLAQTQEKGLGDLIPENSELYFPFSIEVKRYGGKGWTAKPEWERQVLAAAKKSGNHPVLLYRYDNQEWRVRLWAETVSAALGTDAVAGWWVDMSVQGFAWMAREIMARGAAK